MGLEFLTLHQSHQSTDQGPGGPPPDIGDRRKSNIRLAVALLFFLIYLAVGAAIFSAIEAPQEDKFALNLRKYLSEFKQTHEDCIEEKELEQLIDKIIEATQKGVTASKNVSFDNNWGFGQAFFFSGTLVTTVGYGHVSPVTQPGKAFTIVYCIIGIPLFLILLTGFVDRLKYPSVWLLGKMNTRFGHLHRASQIQFMHLGLLLVLLLVFMFLVPALIFMSLEKTWTYLDAFYYCFISLTTIGLGDYIPGDKAEQANRAVYKIFTTGYLMIGILCMMLFLAAVYDVPQLNVSQIFLLPHNGDAERSRLADRSAPGPKYVRQIDEGDSRMSPSSTTSQVATEDSYQYH